MIQVSMGRFFALRLLNVLIHRWNHWIFLSEFQMIHFPQQPLLINLWTNSCFSESLTPPSKRLEKARGGQKGRSQSTGCHMCLLTWDRMQSLLPHFQTTSAILIQEWNRAHIWTAEEHLPHVLANLGIFTSQAPSKQTHLQKMWSGCLAPPILEF